MAAIAPPTRRGRVARFFSDQRKWTPYIFLAPFFITFAVFTLYPMLRAITMAFQESVGYTGQWDWVGLENFAEAFTDRRVWVALENFISYTIGSLVTQMPAAFLLALLLTSAFLVARGFHRTAFFIPSVLPGVTMGVIGVWFFNEARGFANALLLALGAEPIAWLSSPRFIMPMLLTLAFWLYMGNHAVFLIAGLTGLDRSVLEAATVDGATGWQKARFVSLPLLKPVFAYITITAAAGSLTAYEVPYVFFTGSGTGFGGPAGQGWFFMPYIVWMAFNQFRMGYATAIGWLVFIVAIVITVLQLRVFDIGELD
jgi:ABC-type sugar transport system permease subunit